MYYNRRATRRAPHYPITHAKTKQSLGRWIFSIATIRQQQQHHRCFSLITAARAARYFPRSRAHSNVSKNSNEGGRGACARASPAKALISRALRGPASFRRLKGLGSLRFGPPAAARYVSRFIFRFRSDFFLLPPARERALCGPERALFACARLITANALLLLRAIS